MTGSLYDSYVQTVLAEILKQPMMVALMRADSDWFDPSHQNFGQVSQAAVEVQELHGTRVEGHKIVAEPVKFDPISEKIDGAVIYSAGGAPDKSTLIGFHRPIKDYPLNQPVVADWPTEGVVLL